MNSQRNSGQLAVGLAFGFVCILAMFGLVFQSSLNTHDKMKIQTTSDIASIVAADVQAQNLNFIQAMNESIETKWLGLEVLMNTSQCNIVIASCASVYTCVQSFISGFLGSNAATPDTLDPDVSSDVCDQLCDKYDKKLKNINIQIYKAYQSQAASAILTSITDASGMGFDLALDTFLAPKNLPSGLSAEMRKKFGNGYTLNNVKNAYNDGSLNNNDYGYQILDQSKNDPLFIPFQESRTTLHSNFYYGTVYNAYTGGIQSCTAAGPVGDIKVTSLPYRVTRANDYTTRFFTGIKYSPPSSIIEKMVKVGVKNPDTTDDEKFGKEIPDSRLFKRKIRSIFAISAAKPYGGEFPKAGDLTGSPIALVQAIFGGGSGFSAFGTSGTNFKKAKLFGIADTEEIGNERLDRADSCIDQVDSDGNVIGCIPYVAEDFLH